MIPAVVNMHVDRAPNEQFEVNIFPGPNVEVRVHGVEERRRELIQRVRDLCTIPAFTGMALGIYQMAVIASAATGLDFTMTLSIVSSTVAGSGVLYASETARNGTVNGLNLMGRITRNAAFGLTNATRRFFEMIGNGTEWTARQLPASTGIIVAGSAVYMAERSGLSPYAREQAPVVASYLAEVLPQLAANYTSAVLDFANPHLENTTLPELPTNITERIGNLTSAVLEFINSDINTTHPEL